MLEPSIDELSAQAALLRQGSAEERTQVLEMLADACRRENGASEVVIGLLYKAVAESPSRGDLWLRIAEEMREQANWPNCFAAAVNASRCFRARSGAETRQIEELYFLSGLMLGIPRANLEAMREQVVS